MKSAFVWVLNHWNDAPVWKRVIFLPSYLFFGLLCLTIDVFRIALVLAIILIAIFSDWAISIAGWYAFAHYILKVI